MKQPSRDARAALRKSVYALLIVIGAGAMIGRILSVDSIDQYGLERYRRSMIPRQLAQKRQRLEAQGAAPARIEEELQRTQAELTRRASLRRPFLSSNDRSRWCTIRALVEKDLWVSAPARHGDRVRNVWVPYAIDKVIAQPGWDTIDMVKHAIPSQGTGREFLYSSKPPLLPTLMAIPYYVIHRATGATLATHPYAIGRAMLILLNVVPLLIYWVLLARLVERFGRTDWGRLFVVAAAVFGTFLTTFAVTLNNHLPGAASAMIALYAAVRIWFDDERRLRYFVVAGLFGAFTVACELPALTLAAALAAALLWKAPRPALIGFLPAALVVAAGFFLTNWIAHEDLRPPYAHQEWYDYEYTRGGDDARPIASYWRNRVGIDRGEPSTVVYAAHVLVGHHGIFSLTPVWILTLIGLGIWLSPGQHPRRRQLAALILAITVVCLGFYLLQPQRNRNYGGMTSGFRWAFWFAPLWLVAMIPAADRAAGRRGTRAAALVLLGLSVLSAAYPTWNPWTHPWIFDLFHYLGWIRY